MENIKRKEVVSAEKVFLKILDEVIKQNQAQNNGKVKEMKRYNLKEPIEYNLKALGIYDDVRKRFEKEYPDINFEFFLSEYDSKINGLRHKDKGKGSSNIVKIKPPYRTNHHLHELSDEFNLQIQSFLEGWNKQNKETGLLRKPIELNYAKITHIKTVKTWKDENIKKCIFIFEYPDGQKGKVPIYVDNDFDLRNFANREIIANIFSTPIELNNIICGRGEYDGKASYIGTPTKKKDRVKYGVGKNTEYKEVTQYKCNYNPERAEEVRIMINEEAKIIEKSEYRYIDVLKNDIIKKSNVTINVKQKEKVKLQTWYFINIRNVKEQIGINGKSSYDCIMHLIKIEQQLDDNGEIKEHLTQVKNQKIILSKEELDKLETEPEDMLTAIFKNFEKWREHQKNNNNIEDRFILGEEAKKLARILKQTR